MNDIVFPGGNENEFIEMAKRLGYDSLVFVYEDKKKIRKFTSSFPVKTAILCPPKKIHGTNSAGHLSFVRGHGTAREAIERSAHCIFGIEDERRDSMHYRRSGLNQVLCKLANSKGVAVGFSFAEILNTRRWKRSLVLGRMMQNIRLCRKYKVKMLIGSFADDPMKMRSAHDLRSFFHVIGMHPSESLASFRFFK